MDNLNKFVNYLQDVVKQNNSKEMSFPPSTSSGCISGASEEDNSERLDKSVDSFCNVSAETYLSLPEEVMSLTTIKDLETAIMHCKTMILERPDDSDEKKWLVRRLIELRLRLETVKEIKENSTLENMNQNYKVLLGHHFTLQNLPLSTAKYYCDRCSGVIWSVIHTWYLCTECDYKCHVRCLNRVCRICAHVLVSENPKFLTDICPESENGLADQNYRCAECLTHTSFTNNSRTIGFRAVHTLGQLSASGDSVLEPRLCDYNGKYYCPTCHWNSACVIPARIIHNWDFKERRVCRSSKQILTLMAKLPILKLEELNPVLFASIEELNEVKVLRQQLLQIKKYLTSCKNALESRLLWQLGDRFHFIENENTYSLQDLIDLRSGDLLQYLNKLQDAFIKHIKIDCQVCYGRGYCCELCSDQKVIFPFEKNVISCPNCQSAFHFSCWVKINQQCRKCDRIQQRLVQSTSVES